MSDDDEIWNDVERMTLKLQQKRWVENQRKLLDQRRRIRAGHVTPQRPACKVLPLVRRTA